MRALLRRSARSSAKRSRHGARAAGCTAGLSPESATPTACAHTRTAPSDSLSAASSVLSQPREPALVTRARMDSSGCAALVQHLGETVRSYSGPRCSRWLRLSTLYSSGGGTMSARALASSGGDARASRSSTSARYSACAEVHTAAPYASA